jgi:hypothetical protein
MISIKNSTGSYQIDSAQIVTGTLADYDQINDIVGMISDDEQDFLRIIGKIVMELNDPYTFGDVTAQQWTLNHQPYQAIPASTLARFDLRTSSSDTPTTQPHHQPTDSEIRKQLLKRPISSTSKLLGHGRYTLSPGTRGDGAVAGEYPANI